MGQPAFLVGRTGSREIKYESMSAIPRLDCLQRRSNFFLSGSRIRMVVLVGFMRLSTNIYISLHHGAAMSRGNLLKSTKICVALLWRR